MKVVPLPGKKLTEYLRFNYATDYAAYDAAKHLEADSQMLDDLIEIQLSEVLTIRDNGGGDDQEYLVWLEDKDFYGSTPREAIAAAIKEWKKK